MMTTSTSHPRLLPDRLLALIQPKKDEEVLTEEVAIRHLTAWIFRIVRHSLLWGQLLMGHPLANVSVSRSTIRRSRMENHEVATSRDKSFSPSDPLLLGCKAAARHRWWSAQSGQSSSSRLWRRCGEVPWSPSDCSWYWWRTGQCMFEHSWWLAAVIVKDGQERATSFLVKQPPDWSTDLTYLNLSNSSAVRCVTKVSRGIWWLNLPPSSLLKVWFWRML